MSHIDDGMPDDSALDLVAGWNPVSEAEPFPSFPAQDPPCRQDEAPVSGVIEARRFWGGPESEPEPAGEDRWVRGFRLVSERSWDGDRGSPESAADPRPGPNPRAAGAPRSPAFASLRKGDEIAGFQIVSELGRGAFARVYLARQKDLGQRLVALKVSRAEGDEPRLLAQLQHTHIVPIHSVHDDPRTGLRLMCMPYLGGANLAQVIEATGAKQPEEVTGRSLVEALDVVSNRFQSMAGPAQDLLSLPESLRPSMAAARIPTIGRRDEPSRLPARSLSRIQSLWDHIPWRRHANDGADGVGGDETEPMQPARRFLREADHIQASVWIIARLTEGLDHAHSRGMLHRDLKPSNILIAADGTPMLLDFNLASMQRVSEAEEGTRAHVGGTLPYMAPEHLDAFNPNGTTPPEAVNEQSDLYSMGLILYELVAGRYPFAEPPRSAALPETIRFMLEQRATVPSLRRDCPRVSWSLDSIVAKCLAPDPKRRYARARDLADDLRRYLDDLPLKHAPETSLRERIRKWARRNPSVGSAGSVALLAMTLFVVLGGIMGFLASNLRQVSARLRHQVFQSQFEEYQFLLNTASGPLDHLRQGIEGAEQALNELGFGADGDWTAESWVRKLSEPEQIVVRERACELILLEARGRAVLAERLGNEADRRAALEWAVARLDRAEQLDPRPPAALYETRALYLAKLGMAERAARDRSRAATTPLASSRDFTLRGTARLARGELVNAEADLRRALSIDGRSFWAWFALGHCHFEQGRYLEAAGDFGTCTALEPRFAWPYMNRGLALAKGGRLVDARTAYEQALARNSRFVEARVNRALVLLELNDLAEAERDLDQAVALRRDDPGVLAILGEVKARRGRPAEAERIYERLLRKDPNNGTYRVARGFFRLETNPSGARADFERALATDSRNGRAQYGLALLSRKDQPDDALQHVEAALDADPSLIDALQLRALLRARHGDAATKDDVDRLVAAPTAHRLYNAACALAILSRSADPPSARRAVSLLDRALDLGFPSAQAAVDPDLRPLHDLPEYQKTIKKKRP